MEMFDEDKAIEYINRSLETRGIKAYNSDDIINIIDIIWEYYEENGMLDVDDDEIDDDEDIVEDLVEYITRMLKKDKLNAVAIDHIRPIVEAELEYEDSLIDF